MGLLLGCGSWLNWGWEYGYYASGWCYVWSYVVAYCYVGLVCGGVEYCVVLCWEVGYGWWVWVVFV